MTTKGSVQWALHSHELNEFHLQRDSNLRPSDPMSGTLTTSVRRLRNLSSTVYLCSLICKSRAVKMPCPTCPTCPISLRTSKKFNLLVQGLGLYRSPRLWDIFFLFLKENKRCRYWLEAPQRGASNEYPQHMLSWRNKKNVNFLASKSWLGKWILTIYLSVDK